MRRTLHVPAVVAIAVGLLACGHEERAQPAVPSDVTTVRMTSGSVEATQDLDDPQIATIAETLRDGLEERARLAVDAGSDGVRRYARRILADDPGVSITLMNLAPRTSILDDELASDTTASTEALSAARGAPDFDRRFAEAERTALRSAIRLLEQRLIPSADDVHLRANLVRMNATMQDELRDLDRLVPQVPVPPTVTPTPALR